MAAPKKERIPEFHFYEWRLASWAMSETRGRLKAMGRGIYRELLDQCYGQGKFPDDPEWICTRCACSVEELDSVWPIIKKHFPISKKGGYRHNKNADVIRLNYFRLCTEQRRRRKVGLDKTNELNRLSAVGSTKGDSPKIRGSTKLPKLTNLTNLTKLTTTTAVQQMVFLMSDWPKTSRIIRKHFPDASAGVIQGIIEKSYAAFLSVDGRDTNELTDTELSLAVVQCKKDKQYSAGLFLETVPECIRSWATPDDDPLGGELNA